MKISRREFLKHSSQVSAAAFLGSNLGITALSKLASHSGGHAAQSPPNILLIMVDQMRTPPEGYGEHEGMAPGLKEIVGFRPLSADNDYTRFFPGLLRLRQNAVVMRKHHTASAACVPSRTCIMTGQYPTVTGVEHTDGLFKSAHDVPWLDPQGVPTIGDWFRAVGYSTHYFGKWHVSDVPEDTKSLDGWGFSDWETSYPEPHGGPADNAGAFRDVEFADRVVEFFEKKKNDSSGTPWLAVGSLLNPHDCSIWPINWQAPANRGVVPWASYPPPPSIPVQGETSRLGGVYSQHSVELNPDGFPQNNSTLPSTYDESLNDKPHCHKEFLYKWGYAFGSLIDYNFIQNQVPIRCPEPFRLQGDYMVSWQLGYNQFYFYLHYLMDLQLRRILQSLDENGLTENTIVVFLSDHGELAGAHGGMIQKWHNAYEETIRVPMIISSPLVNPDSQVMREITQPTSSIDLAPTILALAGYDENDVRENMKTICGESAVKPFAGADLSDHINGQTSGPIIGPDGSPRQGVFFMTNDAITDLCRNPSSTTQEQYDLFQSYVQDGIQFGLPLLPGSVCQPNQVRALCTGDWKVVRYDDPHGVEPDEWEFYCLTSDPVERINLVDFRTGQIRQDVSVIGMTHQELVAKLSQMKAELAARETGLTGIAEHSTISRKPELSPNYPNPFNSQTTIPFQIPESGPVKLSVIDMMGREVMVLVDRILPAGLHHLNLNADHLASGVYFIRLDFGHQSMVRKITVVK